MCALLWKIITWCHHYHITLKARHIPGCLNMMADLLSRSNQVQSTQWSLHPQVFKQICQKWFTPRSICHSSEPQTSTVRVSNPRPKGLGHRCSGYKLDGSHCVCLPSDGSPSQGDPKNQAIQLPDHSNSPRLARDALLLGPSAALDRDPTTTPSVKQISDFFMYLYQDLNRRPSTIDGYSTAIVDTLGPAGHHIALSSDLHRLLSSFHRDRPKVPRILQSGTLLLFSMSSQKHPLSL